MPALHETMRKRSKLPRNASFRKSIAAIGALDSEIVVPGIGKLTKGQRVIFEMFKSAEAGNEGAIKFLATHMDGAKVVISNEEFAVAVVEAALGFVPEEKWSEFRLAVKAVLGEES